MKYEAPLPVQSHHWMQVFQFLLSHHGISQPKSKKKNHLLFFLKVFLAFFISFLHISRYPLEFMSSLTKQQALMLPVASAKLLVSPLFTYLLVQYAAPLNFLSKFLEGSGKASTYPRNLPTHCLSQQTAWGNIKLKFRICIAEDKHLGKTGQAIFKGKSPLQGR